MHNIQALLPFVQTVRAGSFVAAAAQLQLTPSAISKGIIRLEKELGVRLFNRTTRKLSLTQEGRELYRRASPLLANLDAAIASVTNQSQTPAGLIRVSVTPSFGRYCLMPVIAGFLGRYPDIELDISISEALPNLVEGGFDIAIHHQRGRGTNHVRRMLCEYPIILVASPEYLQRKGTPQGPRDLANHHCIGVRLPFEKYALHLVRIRPGKGTKTAGAEERYSLVPRTPLTIADQIDASLIAALYGAGIAPASIPTARPYLRSGRLKVVLPDYRIRHPKDPELRVYLHYPHRARLPVKLRAFIDFLVAEFHSVEADREQRSCD